MKKLDFGFEKSTIEELNKKLIDSIRTIIPTKSYYYKEVVAWKFFNFIFLKNNFLQKFVLGRHVLKTQNIPKITKWVTSFGYGEDSPFRSWRLW